MFFIFFFPDCGLILYKEIVKCVSEMMTLLPYKIINAIVFPGILFSVVINKTRVMVNALFGIFYVEFLPNFLDK